MHTESNTPFIVPDLPVDQLATITASLVMFSRFCSVNNALFNDPNYHGLSLNELHRMTVAYSEHMTPILQVKSKLKEANTDKVIPIQDVLGYEPDQLDPEDNQDA